MTTTSELIRDRLSFGLTDWRISGDDQAAVVAALDADRNVDATARDLGREGLSLVFNRMGNPGHQRGAMQVLAGRTTSQRAAIRAAVQQAMRPVSGGGMGGAHISTVMRTSTYYGGTALQFFDICAALGDAVRRDGLDSTAGCAAPSRNHAGAGAGSPFSGVGATGVNATTLSVPWLDQAAMLAGHEPTKARYRNPLVSMRVYIAGLSNAQRLAQASQLVCQPVSTLAALVYPSGRPSRSLVISKAARRYNIEPELISAVILAEQRDQSRNEDAVEYNAATSLLASNTSLGLGQVVISTARNHDLFRDLGTTASGLPHDLIASLLVSDEFNIYATAKYIRHVADRGAGASASGQARIVAAFPGLSLPAYRGNSSTWPFPNVQALGMEYTSAPWDNQTTGYYWGEFVGEGYQTLKRTRIAFPP